MLKQSGFLFGLIGLFLTNLAQADLQVVQSVPLETTLAVPGVPMTQQVWLDMINAAKSTLDLEQFYVSEQAGQELTPVIQAIQAAAARGVKVRLLVDSQFFPTYPDTVTMLGKLANVQTKTIDFSKYGGIQHAKFFIVDGVQSFEGSANFDWRALNQIHEVGFWITDATISAQLETIFNKDWAVGTVVPGTNQASASVRLLESFEAAVHRAYTNASSGLQATLDATPAQLNPPGIKYSGDTIVNLINSAKKTIQIQVYEYTTEGNAKGTTWTLLDDAIRAAAARGVSVQLAVDAVDLKDGGPALTALAHLPNIEVKTVKIPAWSGGPVQYGRLIHSKYIVVDQDSAWVGTANWIESYFTGTRNVGIVVQSTSLAATLTQIFHQVWTSAYTSEVN